MFVDEEEIDYKLLLENFMVRRLAMFVAGLILSAGMAMAQKQVSGTVISSEDSEPIIGAAIKVLGTNIGTVTDIDGNFHLVMPDDQSKISVSYIGMSTQELTAQSNMKITLHPDDHSLDEVVVVAYGTARRQSITGAVTSVDSKDIEKRIGTSVTSALEGSAPGIQVNSTYGEPGKDPKINIRGIGTLTKYDAEGNDASQPLYVVDGMAYNGNISDINPNDIQSMSVLKDAASAALYGNRAANGVIIITTKSGRTASRPSFSLKINQGIYSRGMKEYDRLGADKWMEASWQAMKNYALSNGNVNNEADAAAYATKHLIDDYAKRNIYDAAKDALFDANGKLTATRLAGYDDLDWYDAIERNGYRQEYNLSGQAASEKFNVFSSVGYLNEKGYIISSDLERFTGRINSIFKPNQYFELGINLNASLSRMHNNPNAKESYSANPFYTARFMAPIYPTYAHDDKGEYILDGDGNRQFDLTSSYLNNRNIAYELRADKTLKEHNQLGAQAYLNINLPYNFTLTFKGDVSSLQDNGSEYNNPNIGDGATNNGRLTNQTYRYKTFNGQELLNWNQDFDVHHIDATLGHENYRYKGKLFYGMNTDMAADGIYVLSNFLTNSYLSGYNYEDKQESYLARARYNYDEKYFFDASVRLDGSSRFAKGHRWGDFYSFGASWNIAKEDFMKDYKWVNDLRLRASYGEVGNNKAVGFYAYQALYYITKNGGQAALMKQSLSSDEIKWETSQTVDIALEGKLFDRLNFSLGYFNRTSKDLLMAVKLPQSAGAYAYDNESKNLTKYQNIGSIRNSGFEFNADYDIIKSKDLKWNAGFDATFLSNKIKKLVNHANYTRSALKTYAEGHSVYEYYTYHFEGVDQMTGLSLYTLDPAKEAAAANAEELVEINGKKYTTDTAYGLKGFHGTAKPTVYGSFHTGLSWKDLSLSMMFTYSLGDKVYDGSYQTMMSVNSASSASALHNDALKSWVAVPEGMTATSANRIDKDGVPSLDFVRSTYSNATSDRWLTSASYLVCKNINLAYRLPVSFLQNYGIDGLTLTAGVENLFTVSARQGMNPQNSFDGILDDTYVTPRVFNFGLQVNF